MKTQPRIGAHRDGVIDVTRIVRALLLYLGVSFFLPQYLDVDLGPLSASLVVPLGVAVLAWMTKRPGRAELPYLACGAAFAVALVLSSVALWDTGALYWSVTTSVWLLVIIPGLGRLLADDRMRRTFVLGISIGAAYYGAARLWGMTFGSPKPVLGAEGVVQDFLGYSRNDIDSQIVFAIPLILFHSPRDGRRRLVLGGFTLVWLMFGGGRIGPLALVATGLVIAQLQPNISRRVSALIAALLLFAFGYGVVNVIGGDAAIAVNRSLNYVTGERTQADEQRDLRLRKGWSVGWDNPIFGVGYGRLQGATDEVVTQARTAAEQQRAIQGGAHNMYVWAFASFGLPGLVTLAAILGVLVLLGVRARADPDVRATTTALVAMMVAIGFHTPRLELIFFPLALVIGALGREPTRSEPAAEPAAA